MAAAIAFVLGVAVPLAGCGAGNGPAPEPTGGAKRLKVALLVPGLTNDGSFNQVAREAVERLEQEGRVDADIREKMADPAVAEPVVREYATKGYDLVIGHGIELLEPVLKVAGAFPKVHFAVAGGPDALRRAAANVEVWTFDFGQQGYLAGFVAGKIRDVRTAGLVSGPQLPFLETIHSGFKAGLKDADPSRRWLEVYTGSFDDVQKAVEATTGLIDQGAQVIFTTGDGIAFGVASAAARREPKALTIGVTGDAGGLARQVNVTSIELDMYPTFRSYVDRVAAGAFGNQGYTADLANKGLVPTPIAEGARDPRVPTDLQVQVDKLVADLASGARKLPSFGP
ncbi:MAG TPA: BMP family protein [Micromonosporaceae bacterium]|nr:BMP family protein [Micromonosporaceae bacterium]